MMGEPMELKDIVMTLIGDVSPVGETNADNRSYDNLQRLINLTEELMIDIKRIADLNKDRQEFSMQRSGKYCDEYLARVRGWLND